MKYPTFSFEGAVFIGVNLPDRVIYCINYYVNYSSGNFEPDRR
jgi:hypothetical protein